VSEAAAPFLRLEHVSKSYDSVIDGPPVRVLDDISLSIGQGESVAISGASGSGKSTLLNIIGTLDEPTQGSVFLKDQDLSKLKEKQLAGVRARQIGFIFQAHHLLPQCSVLENVLIPTLGSSDSDRRKGAPERAKKLLERVGLGARIDHRPGQLSGGEQQRVAVVRALINQPELLLADEPTGALDRASAEELARLLIELNREEKVTLILVTHAADLAARMGRVFHLQDGRLMENQASPS
jgi:ABC-type lipoprotein export system ATPase subunit